MKNKSLILGILFLLLVGGVVYFSQKRATDNIVEDIKIASWKTWQDDPVDMHTFDFSYPGDFTVSDTYNRRGNQETESGTTRMPFRTTVFSNAAGKAQFTVMQFGTSKEDAKIIGKKPPVTISDFSNGYLSLGSVCDTRWAQAVEGIIPLAIDGTPAIKATVISADGTGAGCYYFKNREGYIVALSVSGFSSEADFVKAFALLEEKIIPTVKTVK